MEIKGTQPAKDLTKYSDKVLRAKEKLVKQIAVENQLRTPAAIANAAKKNIDWLDRHKEERVEVDLTTRQVTYFAGNKYSATDSKTVSQMKEKLQKPAIGPIPLTGQEAAPAA